MTDVVNTTIPTKKENRRFEIGVVFRVFLALVVVGITIALVTQTATGRSQQDTINRNDQASRCRSQVVAETDGVINGSLALLLQDPQADGIIEILDSIVLLGNRQPLNYEEIAMVSQGIKTAQLERKAYVSNVSEAIARREQAISACDQATKN